MWNKIDVSKKTRIETEVIATLSKSKVYCCLGL